MNTQEYERLAEKYLDCIYRVAVNGCKHHADAEDVVQNTFVKLWERTESFTDEEHARKWLIRDIAEMMKLSETAVKTRLLRARQKLKSAMEACDVRYMTTARGITAIIWFLL